MGKTIFTNECGLPETIVRAVKNDGHPVAGRLSVTQAWGPPQIRQLKIKNDIVEDVIDRIWMLLGTCIHILIERGYPQSKEISAINLTIDTVTRILRQEHPSPEEKERLLRIVEDLRWMLIRFYPDFESRYIMEYTMAVDLPGGMKLYGTFDLYDRLTELLDDYKVTSTYSYLKGADKKEWENQLNTYAFMAQMKHYRNGELQEPLPVKGLRIHTIYRDWSKMASLRERDYPNTQFGTHNLKMYSQQEWWEKLWPRIYWHNQADKGEYIPCTGDDMWEKKPAFKVWKAGNKRATKNFLSQEAAENFIANMKNEKDRKNYEVRRKKGERTRCENYCSVSSVCPQFRQYQLNKDSNV